MHHLKRRLDRLYDGFDFSAHVRNDPIEWVGRYSDAADIETAGFLVSCLSFGRVTLFKPVLARMLDHMGSSPSAYVRDFQKAAVRKRFPDIRYRFATRDDLVALVYALSELLKRKGSLKAVCASGLKDSDETIGGALAAVSRAVRSVNLSAVYGRHVQTQGFRHLVPDFSLGGACKRMALYLRWMVRDRDIDFGIWKDFKSSRLVVPLDTHMLRICRCLGFTKSRQASWKAALEITAALRRFDAADPLRYDFVICHQGISGVCPSRYSADSCRACRLAG